MTDQRDEELKKEGARAAVARVRNEAAAKLKLAKGYGGSSASYDFSEDAGELEDLACRIEKELGL